MFLRNMWRWKIGTKREKSSRKHARGNNDIVQARNVYDHRELKGQVMEDTRPSERKPLLSLL